MRPEACVGLLTVCWHGDEAPWDRFPPLINFRGHRTSDWRRLSIDLNCQIDVLLTSIQVLAIWDTESITIYTAGYEWGIFCIYWTQIGFLSDASFGLWVFSLPASVCVCVRLCVNHELVRAITHNPFNLGSLNLDQRCKRPWLRFLFFLWGYWPWPSRSILT